MYGKDPRLELNILAHKGLNSQKIGPGDYFDDEGLLVCGKCGEHRREKISVPVPVDGELVQHPMVVYRACRCDRQAEAEEQRREQEAKYIDLMGRLNALSIKDEKFKDVSFQNYEVTKDNERNLKLCRRYVGNFDRMLETSQGLLFWGGVGTGKSHAAACIANALLRQKIPVVMTSFVRLVSMIQNDELTDTVIINRLNKAKLVIFDDLGAERGSEYAQEKVYSIIDARLQRNLPMILTTNLTINEMKQEENPKYRRIYDRIFEICYPMQFTGTSWRRKSASRRFYDMEKLLNGD